MFSIGEFSKITGLSVKTLRFYHEKELLIPSSVDPASGYRYYDGRGVEKARVITHLRRLEFSLNEIGEILDQYDDQADILDYLERQKELIEARIQHHRNIIVSLNTMISNERQAQQIMENPTYQVEEKVLDAVWVAGIRIKGKYSDCGQVFGQIGKALGRYLCGKPMNLYYNEDYREDDADLEPCIPIRKPVEADGISVRELPGGQCVYLMHQGPYEDLGRSYAKILDYLRQKGYEVILPSREVYHKGPGMIFKGNPKKYLTEIQMLIKA